MLFKNIKDEIIKKTFIQMKKYIADINVIADVSTKLKEIGSDPDNARIILSSYLIRYNTKKILMGSKLDAQILLDSVRLHTILDANNSNLIKQNKIKEYVFLYNKWTKSETHRQINKLISEYNYANNDDQILLRDRILALDPINGKKKLERSIVKNNRISIHVRDSFRHTYNNYVRKKLINNEIEILTKNFKELRAMLLTCTIDKKLREEIINNLYIKYLSDEELYNFLLKIFKYILELSSDSEKPDIKKEICTLKYNVSKDIEMHEFIPELMDIAFTRIEILMKK
tara:strand:- start:3446 stop:4303 length:858 start_codon:yes stop_codon:yes gene_type:complete